jgi:hypothetical protein
MQKPYKKNHDSISIQGDGNIVGNRNTSNFSKTGSTPTEFALAFEKIYSVIGRVSDPVIREEAKDYVQKIEAEAQKGEDANPTSIERWLKFLADMVPDVKDVIIDTLSNPIKGISTVITKVIAKAKN